MGRYDPRWVVLGKATAIIGGSYRDVAQAAFAAGVVREFPSRRSAGKTVKLVPRSWVEAQCEQTSGAAPAR